MPQDNFFVVIIDNGFPTLLGPAPEAECRAKCMQLAHEANLTGLDLEIFEKSFCHANEFNNGFSLTEAKPTFNDGPEAAKQFLKK